MEWMDEEDWDLLINTRVNYENYPWNSGAWQIVTVHYMIWILVRLTGFNMKCTSAALRNYPHTRVFRDSVPAGYILDASWWRQHGASTEQPLKTLLQSWALPLESEEPITISQISSIGGEHFYANINKNVQWRESVSRNVDFVYNDTGESKHFCQRHGDRRRI